MKSLRPGWLALLLLATARLGQAEVAVTLDSRGYLERLDVRTDVSLGVVWTRITDRPDALILNPLGDRFGDLPPACGILSMPMDDPTGGHLGVSPTGPASSFPTTQPTGGTGTGPGTGTGTGTGTGGSSITVLRTALVVWARYDGSDFEMVYSLWDPVRRQWTPTGPVVPGNDVVDDVRPWLLVSGDQVYLAWQHASGVLLSIGRPVSRGGFPIVEWLPPVPALPGVLVNGIDFAAAVLGQVPPVGGGRR